jgi:hypothetical protein
MGTYNLQIQSRALLAGTNPAEYLKTLPLGRHTEGPPAEGTSYIEPLC